MRKFAFAGAGAMVCAGTLVFGQTAPVGQQQDPARQSSAQMGAEQEGQTVTLVGCLYREEDVPGRSPNIAERAGILEDYILADARITSSGSESSRTPGAMGTTGGTGTAGTGGAGATTSGAAGTTSGTSAGTASGTTSGEATGTASGSTAGGTTSGSMTGSASAGAATQPAAGSMYKLEHIADEKLSEYVGKRVEVTGRIDAEGDETKPAGTAGATQPQQDRSAGPDRIELPEFEATSIREVPGTCPAKPGQQ